MFYEVGNELAILAPPRGRAHCVLNRTLSVRVLFFFLQEWENGFPFFLFHSTILCDWRFCDQRICRLIREKEMETLEKLVATLLLMFCEAFMLKGGWNR